nr:isochorismatase family cysteine hydrolase [Lacisediminimonas profundi]
MAIEFPQWVVDRVVARQGRLHAYDCMVPQRTAFVVVDLQNYYMMPGYQGECAPARAIIPAVNRLASSLRSAGGTVVWIQTSADGADQFWSHHHSEMLTPERSQRRLRELASSSPGFALHPELDARPEDPRVVKRCYSALTEGSSNLAEMLRSRGIDTVLIGGTVTNVCCESTARDAMMMNFRTVMVEDALASVTEQEQLHSLYNWMLYFGDVLSVGQVEAAIGRSAQEAAA